ncbi:response regulator [Primorskyibacter sp. S187A]|uniref:response regulator n=1 Tax=Primorskyibacter sp. S187A TaxID=3415130 RepID=UPI003C7BB312
MSHAKKLLLVEDDAFTRFMMKEIITTLGVEAEYAVNGQESIDLINADPGAFGLVLMDLHMPVMSGIEATHGIRASESNPPRDVPIVAVTADVSYHDDAVVKELGMDGFAAKPVSPGRLLDLVTTYCQVA